MFAPENSSGMWAGTFETFNVYQGAPDDFNETYYSRRVQTLENNRTVDFTTTLPFLSNFNADFSQDPAGELPVLSWQTARTATYNGQIAAFSWEGDAEWDFITPGGTSINVPALLPVDGVALLPTNDATQNPIRSYFAGFTKGLDSSSVDSLAIDILSLQSTSIPSYDVVRLGLPDNFVAYLDTPPDTLVLMEAFQYPGAIRAKHQPSLVAGVTAALAHPEATRRLAGHVQHHAIPSARPPSTAEARYSSLRLRPRPELSTVTDLS